MLTAAVGVVAALLAVALGRWLLMRRQQHQFFDRIGMAYVKPHFLYGSTHILRNKSTTQIAVMTKWKNTYGKVFGFFSGGRPTMVISDLDMVKQILIKDFHNFSNRPSTVIKAQPVISTLLGLRDQRWKEVRSLLAPTFSMTKMKLMAGIMNQKIDVLLKIFSDYGKKDEPIECYTTYQRLTLDVICECALALKSKCQTNLDDSLLSAVLGFLKNAINPFIILAVYFPTMGQLLSYISRRLAYSGRMTNMIMKHLKQVIAIRRKDAQTKTVDVLQLMLEASETIIEERQGKDETGAIPKKKMLTDEEIVANAWVFLIGGFETTANAITFTSFLIAKDKECQDKLYEEIKGIVQDSTSNVTYEQISQMPYLDQVFSESLRLYPPVVTFITREAAQDSEVCGVQIPGKTTIMIPVWDIHRDPDQWPEPDKFDPERFSAANKSESSRHSMAYLPFGAGPRNCIGMRFGQLEAKIAIARVILNFELELSPKTVDPLPLVIYTVAINPSKGIYLRVRPRH